MTREIVSVNLNGTRFPADIVSKNDFDFMRQDGDIGSMDYDQAVKNGEIFFGWSMWMEQDGYAPGESIAFDFENGSGTYTYKGKIAGSFVSADTYLVIPEGVYPAVSYTHLDVYKRQIWGNSALMVSMVNISSDRIASAFSNFRIAQVSDLHNAESVSYTHLDVYKRQV